MSLSDLKGSSPKRKGDAKKEGRGGGNAERVLSAYEVASKGISLKLHPRISQQTQEGHIKWSMGRAGEGIDAVYSSTDKRLSEDGKLCKDFVTTPPTSQLTVNFGFDGLPKSATNVTMERAGGVRVLDLYEGMIKFVENASAVENEEGEEIELSEVFGEFELLYFSEPKKGSIELLPVLQD